MILNHLLMEVTWLLGGGNYAWITSDKRVAYNFHQKISYISGAGRIFNVHFPIFVFSTVYDGTISLLEGRQIEGQ
jgi:hypothetical protein